MQMLSHRTIPSTYFYGVLIVAFSIILLVQSAQGADTTGMPAVNLPFVSLSTRFLPGTSPRNEFVLLAPAGIGDAARSGAVLGGFYLDSLVFASKNDYRASSTGVGKLYYLPPYGTTTSIYIVPHVTIYRMMGIWYLDLSGEQIDLWEHQWGLVGAELLVRLGEGWEFHADVDPRSYSGMKNNYRLRAGIGLKLDVEASVSAVYERAEWNIETSKDAASFTYRGSSESVYLKGIYGVEKQGKPTGASLFLSAGYEHMLNSGNNALLAPGDISARGWLLGCGFILGQAAW